MFHRILYGDLMRHADRARLVRVSKPATNLYLVQQQLSVADRKLPIYHVALLGEDVETGARRVFEHGPIGIREEAKGMLENAVFSPLPAVEHTILEIGEFEDTLPKRYLVGARDCRHHVRDLLLWCYKL